MNVSREGKSDVHVADVVEIAKSAGQAIMAVYSEDPDVSAAFLVSHFEYSTSTTMMYRVFPIDQR